MWKGMVVGVYIAADARGPMVEVQEVRAVPGRGLEGDRYWSGTGTYWKPSRPDREATLIEIEALEALMRDYDIALPPELSRRNIVTRGVPLNHLVNRTFRVGEVTLRGIRLCEPCAHLEAVSGVAARRALVHRGGLRAQILSPGTIRIGDPVEPVEEEHSPPG
jgi:MOSC domain-containing protein YiiM